MARGGARPTGCSAISTPLHAAVSSAPPLLPFIVYDRAMLKGLDPLLGPELLSILRAMGHGDELALVDANFPAAASAKRLVRLDGIPATRVLTAVLSVLPLDDFVDSPATRMAVVD